MTDLLSILSILSPLSASENLKRPDRLIQHLSIDSRKIINPSQTLFFALVAQRNGHDYIKELIDRGVCAFVISEETRSDAFKQYTDVDFLLVSDTTKALQALAAAHRSAFSCPVIAITGSNGKTMVKEWLFQLLSPDHHIIRSPKSYNSQVGVPLSVWQMHADTDLCLFEAGISKRGEMEALEQIIQPTIGLLTNIASAHDEGFSSRTEKLSEKLNLFLNCELLIYQAEALNNVSIPGKKHFTWSFQKPQKRGLFVEKISKGSTGTRLVGRHEGIEQSLTIPFTDDASIQNAVSCWAVLLALKIPAETIAERLASLSPIEMRLKLTEGTNNCALINDSYNSDINSLSIALDFLKQQEQHSRRTVILSDIFQSGLEPEILYQQVDELLQAAEVSHLIGIGPEISAQANCFHIEKEFFPDTESFITSLLNSSFINESILLKGSRRFEFEKISKLLERRLHETIFEINLNALIQNLNYYRSKLNPGTKIMAMVKAFSYGSGTHEIASILRFHRVDYLAVAYVDEGVTLRQGGAELPIMVMSPEVSAFESLCAGHMEPEIYGFRILNEFIAYLATHQSPSPYPIHLKIDTGMHRLGFREEELARLLAILQASPQLKVISVFSHLASSEAAEEDGFTNEQLVCFNRISAHLESKLGYSFIKHLCNSAGISRHPNAHLDMVRLGIGLYGIDSSMRDNRSLQTIGTLKTTISQIKELQAGDSVGYNRKGKITRPSRIATVKIGYADGLSRKLGNGIGEMLVNGQRAPIIGNVCMDMTMLDVTDVACRETDEVIVFNDELRVEELAERIGTIPYEVLTGVSQRVNRVYVYE